MWDGRRIDLKLGITCRIRWGLPTVLAYKKFTIFDVTNTIEVDMTTPEDMMNNGFEQHPEMLVTNKHSVTGCSAHSGSSGTTFTLQTENELMNWSSNRNKFNVWGSADSSTAYIFVSRVDGHPIGTNDEMFAKFCSGWYKGTHGWPCSAISALPSAAFPMAFESGSWKR